MVLLAVVARLVDLQIVHSGHYQRLAASEFSVTVADPGLRGVLYDRNGTPMAISVPTKTVVADDFQVAHPAREAAVLSPLLHVPVARLAAQLHQRSGYVILATQVSAEIGSKLNADQLPGITLLDSSERVDPDGGLAGPLLGLVHASGSGASGLEYQYNSLLSGSSGTQTLLESPAGVDLPQGAALTRSAGTNGTGLELTIDQPLQYTTESALAAEIASSNATSGTAMVMDTQTGDVLAMASLVAGNDGLGVVSGVPLPSPVSEAPSNLALTQAYEPGSVFKLVTFSAALEDRVITPDTMFTVPDQIQLAGSTFHDAEYHPTEQLSATQILAQSSNIGTSEVARMLGESRLLAQVQNLGFGKTTALRFPGESRGLTASAAQWKATNYVSLPIGQVDAVTAMQVLDAYNAMANGGVMVQPRLVRGTISPEGQIQPAAPSPSRRVISGSVDAELTKMLEAVVNGGTGTSAAIPGYSVMGKTGTAQIAGRGGYIPGAYMASFVGSAPAQHPVLSAIVVLDRPTPIFGGSVAAPVFAQIMSYALHRYGIPTSSSAPNQTPTTPPSAAGQGQDVT